MYIMILNIKSSHCKKIQAHKSKILLLLSGNGCYSRILSKKGCLMASSTVILVSAFKSSILSKRFYTTSSKPSMEATSLKESFSISLGSLS